MSYTSALYELSEEMSVSSEMYDAAAILRESLLIVPEYVHMLSSPVLPLAVRRHKHLGSLIAGAK